MKNKKVIWIVHGPNSIYTDMFEGLKKENSNLDLIMTGNIDNKKYKNFKNKYFKLKLLKRKNLFKFLFFPWKILYYIKGSFTCDLPTLHYFQGLNKFLEDEKPDLVIANLYYRPSTWQSFWYCKKYNVPFFLQTEIKQLPQGIFSNLLIRLFFILMKSLFNQANLILPWTEDGLLFAKKYFPIKDKSKIRLLSAGINTNFFYPVKTQKNNKIKILIVGRLVPFKRHIDLLNAYKYLKENVQYFDYSLTICGTGPLENKLKQQAKNLNINVNFIKNIPYKKMNKLYSLYNFLVLSSYNEAIGMVVPEAMACSIPCIVSDTCGSKMYITKNTGFVFKTFDIKDLALKIMMMSLVYETFGKDAYKYSNKFKIENISRKLSKKIKTFI